MSTPRFILRPPHHGEAASVLALHRAAVHRLAAAAYAPEILANWSGPITAARIARYHANAGEEQRLVAICQTTRRIAGFGAIVDDKGELRACYIHPDFARQGVGRLIMDALEDIARQAGQTRLWLHGSRNAASFYMACGWEMVEETMHRHHDGQQMACVHMQKRL